MKTKPRTVSVASVSLAALLLLAGTLPLVADTRWHQWGGPRGDFTCDEVELATKWREGGPAEVWSREIGGGHATILHELGVLYTVCRRGDKDAVLAIDAATGKTLWEHQYDAPLAPGMLEDYGVGPHSSPLLAGDRLFTLGGMTHFHCLDKRTGKVLWSHNLNEEYGASCMLRGYGASPIAYKNLVIVSIGAGREAKDPSGLAAFKQENGELVWKSERLIPGYPTPVLANCHGQDMLINCLGTKRFAIDPATGKSLWKVKVDSQSASIISSPLWIPPDKVLFTCGHGGGTRLFQIKQAKETKDNPYSVEELWYYNKFRLMHGNAVRIGDQIYGSTGDLGPAYLMSIDLETGKLKWRERGFSKATLLVTGDKLIILDEDGQLAVAKTTPEKFEILSKAKILKRYSFTAPTLIGTRLYLRDHHTIKCLDLGTAANQ